MKKLYALIMAMVLAVSVAACASEPAKTETTEEKKQLPIASVEEEEEAAPLYKDIMKPYSDIQHGKRLIILQNTLVFSREGIITEAETPVAETVAYNGADYNGFAMTAATKFLMGGDDAKGRVSVFDTNGTETVMTYEEFEASKALIDDFQSGNSPVILKADGAAVENFDYAKFSNGEVIFSIVTEQEVNVNEYLQKFGWDNTKTYNLVATDVFYIPITPEDYDEGGLRGALSGAINANFPDMIIATGKLNDVVFIEEIVE
ncbi:MAG: hypothetical protein IJF29_02475 [Firmicutes bacterium]|nr:hypothetical protein [Bacillota bacterium]